MMERNDESKANDASEAVAGKKSYRRPAIVAREKLEAMAVVCNGPGQKESLPCNQPFQS